MTAASVTERPRLSARVSFRFTVLRFFFLPDGTAAISVSIRPNWEAALQARQKPYPTVIGICVAAFTPSGFKFAPFKINRSTYSGYRREKVRATFPPSLNPSRIICLSRFSSRNPFRSFANCSTVNGLVPLEDFLYVLSYLLLLPGIS